jgi:hypothetical protein
VSRQTDEVVQFAGVNLTGVTVSNVEAIAKRLKLLHELVPAAKSMAFLVNPTNSAATAGEASELQATARVLAWTGRRSGRRSCARRRVAGAAAADRAARGHGRPQLAVYSAHGLADLRQGHLQPQQGGMASSCRQD